MRSNPVNYTLHRVVLLPSRRQIEVAHKTTVLKAIAKVGIELESICGTHQTCGKCVVMPITGTLTAYDITSNTGHLSLRRRYYQPH